VLGSVLGLVVGGGLLLRYTTVGLKVRALVDSEALTGLSGTNPGRVAVGMWAATTCLAGLVGVLLAPLLGGLEAGRYTLLVAAAFAAVIAARLRNVGVAVVVGLLMGVAGSLFDKWFPPTNTFNAGLKNSIPFLFIVGFLLFHVIRSGRVTEETGIGSALDHAIRPQRAEDSQEGPHDSAISRRARVGFNVVIPLTVLVIIALLPQIFSPFWGGDKVALGMAYALAFLSYTLVTGEGGLIWLCQITFAGIGAITAANLATVHGWPFLPAILAGAFLCALLGTAIGFLTIRLGDLYVALVTLTFGLLVESLLFQESVFRNHGAGRPFHRPSFAGTDEALAYLALAAFCVVGLFVLNLRRSTTGLALSAVRSSEVASRTLGISVLQMKVLVSGLGAFVAGIGGVFLALRAGTAAPDNFRVLIGLVWLAVLVNFGIRSNIAAAVAGMVFAYMPALVISYLPSSFGDIPGALFGIGAILIVQAPDGILARYARQLRALILRGSHAAPPAPTAPGPPGIADPVLAGKP
jgi:branched-chain amino acid transport system permease protein